MPGAAARPFVLLPRMKSTIRQEGNIMPHRSIILAPFQTHYQKLKSGRTRAIAVYTHINRSKVYPYSSTRVLERAKRRRST